MPTFNLLIKGRVQGVFYRATARDVAQKLQVKGWVRNTEEGFVEALVSGDAEQVRKFIEWCHKGPAMAEVSEVISTQTDEQNFEGFQILR